MSEKKGSSVQEGDYGLSFSDYERKWGIKVEYPDISSAHYEIPGFPVSRVSGFAWVSEKEQKMVDEYLMGKKRKPVRVTLNVYLYLLRKRIGLA